MRKYITKASERIGVESTSRDGKRAQVVSYSTCENFIIRFCDGKEMKLKNWRYFIEGNFNYEKHFKAPRNREERIGEKKVMNNGLTAEVIEYRGRGNEEAEIIEVKDANHITVKFKDGTIVKDRKYEDFIHGAIGKPGIPQLRRTLKNERLWTEKIMRNGMKAKIVRYGSANDIDIKFSNGTIVMHKTYANFCSGSVACK